ncbi:GH39 family glycosyl hydrolase [Robinsoniella sp. KNHs210]|uniref:GH39 family glycosyl hydrolase n=1 Tax=Robinsoniella sp. KNHs210 TaxID=1469950 RepID=UPI000483B32C|nr:helix-turn-helix domain-containing protein [Robinsoniella sp. KNHs210]
MNKIDERQEEFWFTLVRRGDRRRLWKPQFEIIFILKGKGQIYFANTKTAYTVQEEDIFVINSFEMQNLELEESAVALSFSISLRFLYSMSPEILKYQINCRSFLYSKTKQEAFNILRSDIAKAFEEQYKNVNKPSIYFKSKVTAVLEDLSRYFLDRNHPFVSWGSFESLKPAINYIQSFYRENITLENLAEQTYLSKTYISRSFTKYFGVSFTDYITLLRVAYASGMLQGKDTISKIAFESGFPNVNAMILAFKRYRGSTPGEYRKKLEASEQTVQRYENAGRDEVREDFASLMKYAAKDVQPESPTETMTEITVDINGKKQRISAHWKRIINAGYARSLFEGTVQRELLYLQEKIGFEYIRIKGILDDDMCLLRTDMNGETIVNYAYVDEALDFILSIGAKPMIELGYMPGILAGSIAFQSMRNGIFGAPKSIEQWHDFIKELLLHIVKRYGDKNVRKWLFSPWLPPDFVDLGLCSLEEYEEIYFASYSAIKEVNSNFLITGLGSTDLGRYLKWFLEMCKRRECVPEMITFRSFAAGSEQEEQGLNLIGNNESFSAAVSGDENLIQNTVREMRVVLKEEGLSHIPLILEEWSNNVWQRDLCNDTCYKSAYLFKNILENNENLNGMAYFTLNDRIDEVPPALDTFHGGFGLFTKNDIPKSACRAMELLGQMGESLVQKGNGYYITCTENEIQIFLYNYSHYDLLYRYRHVVNLSRTNRYDVFVSNEPRAFYICFENMDAGTYEMKSYSITKEGGNSYDIWVKMGAPEPLTLEEVKMLQNLSEPLYRRESAEVKEEGILSVKKSLNPQEICLIKIKIF